MGLKSPNLKPGIFNHEFMHHGVKNFMVEKVKGHFNPELFNHKLFNPLVQKFMVEKSGVEMYFNPMYSFRKILSVKESKGFMM